MARIFFFIIFVSALVLFFGLAQLLLLRQLNRVWWQRTWIRRAAYTLPAVGVLSIITLGVAEYNRIGWLATVAGPVTVLALISEVCLMFSLPVSGIVHLTERLLEKWSNKRTPKQDALPDPKRRLLLRSAAVLVPVATLSAGLSGVGRAYAGAEVSLKKFEFASLPSDLNGLRILHLSDLHLGHYIKLDDLESILAGAEPYQADLILVTGDVSDNLDLLSDALAIIAQAKPRLGCYAVLGNHEYFRGITRVRSTFAASEVHLLVDQSVRLMVGETSLRLGGSDDPRTMRGSHASFFHNSLKAVLAGPEDDKFRILMSHRPDAFPVAADRNIDLILAGHTHGGQVGFAGRSLLEETLPDRYLWGQYFIGKSQLYTSCGAGHWFPFRLGCPPEAPVIELTSA